MRLGRSSVAYWSTAWLASVAQWQSRWPTWCRDSTCPSTTLMTLSRGRSPTFPQTSTSWVSSWTLRGRWGCTVPVITVPPARSSSSSPHLPITTSSSWTRWSQHENWLDSLFVVSFGVSEVFWVCQILHQVTQAVGQLQYFCTKRNYQEHLKEQSSDADFIKSSLNALIPNTRMSFAIHHTWH